MHPQLGTKAMANERDAGAGALSSFGRFVAAAPVDGVWLIEVATYGRRCARHDERWPTIDEKLCGPCAVGLRSPRGVGQLSRHKGSQAGY
jgi:hypothetical protein